MADEIMREAILRAAQPNLLGYFHRPGVHQVRHLNFNVNVPGLLNDNQDPHPQEDHRDREDILGVVWVGDVLPLPTVNYPLLWHRYRPASFRAFVTNVLTYSALLMIKFGRTVVYILAASNWIKDTLRFVMMFGSMVTFSENFFQDIFTYAVRGYPLLVERKYEMLQNNSARLVWSGVSQAVVDTLAQNVRANCTYGTLQFEDGSLEPFGECVLNTNSLIFRFSDALVRVFPLFDSVPSVFLTLITISIYVIYGLLAQVFGFNVIFFFLLHSFHRWIGMFSFVGRFAKALWLSTDSMVF